MPIGNAATAQQVQAVANQITVLTAQLAAFQTAQMVANQTALTSEAALQASIDSLATEVELLGDQGTAAVNQLSVLVAALPKV